MSKTKAKKATRESVRIAVDIGGTFTDGLAVIAPGNRIWVGKTLTTPDDPGIAVTTVMADLLKQIAAARGEGQRPVTDVVHGTTLVTNTLIERKGAVTGLIMTRGFRDIIEMGTETRYDIYDLGIDLPPPLVPRAMRREVAERMDAAGAVLTPLDLAESRAVVAALVGDGAAAIAVCLLHSYINPRHEQAIGELIRREFPGIAVSLSSEIQPEIREFERASTTRSCRRNWLRTVPVMIWPSSILNALTTCARRSRTPRRMRTGRTASSRSRKQRSIC